VSVRQRQQTRGPVFQTGPVHGPAGVLLGHQLTPHENLFFSPYSTYHALIIAYFLAGGQTEGYLKKMLRLGEAQVSRRNLLPDRE
jgi:hypothetical protein